ncbi:uncharacterized protein B0H64DRAFT_121410 [Chaetomium fimeti]|uniref:Uncharacterized protein n=1 Tax=Chaetomium fimeti TaxID=1854472 RepID=A0AAE0LTS3_9PEZI|nr:hypothetical protein B0H64DRAFT_121410 [Chaetomium fimeti]
MEPTSDATDPLAKPQFLAEQEPDPSLRTVTKGGPDAGAIDAQVPDARVTAEERFATFDLSAVSHVVIQVSITRQQDIFRRVGYQYDWDRPGPFWHFLGKIAAKAIFNDEIKLDVLNYIPLGRREFICYTTPTWTATVKAREADGLTEPPPLHVIEVNFKKPVPSQPLEMSWVPARDRVLLQIRRWNEDSGGEEDNPDISD